MDRLRGKQAGYKQLQGEGGSAVAPQDEYSDDGYDSQDYEGERLTYGEDEYDYVSTRDRDTRRSIAGVAEIDGAARRLSVAGNTIQELGEDEKQSSIRTIFSIWNTMMGSSLLAIPWGFSQAGYLAGLGTVFVVGCVCYYTSLLIVKHGTGYDDFFDLCLLYLGKKGQALCWASSLLVLLGALMAYDRLMSDCLYYAINGVRENVTGDVPESSDLWSLKMAPLAILVLMFPLLNFKDVGIFVKINSFGILAVLYIMGFIAYTSIGAEGIDLDDLPPQTESNFTSFAGLLTLSFFVHNCVLPIMKNQKNPQHNERDLGIAFILVALSYTAVGALGYLAYHRLPEGVEQNFLNLAPLVGGDQIGAMIARFMLLFQLFSVYPLICYIVRIQFFSYLTGVQYPGLMRVLALNATICAMCTSMSIWYPEIGNILRFTGAACGLLYVFILPIAIHVKVEWFTAKPGEVGLQDPLMWEDENGRSSISTQKPINRLDPYDERAYMDIRPGGKERRKGFVFWGSMGMHSLLIMLGVGSLVAQFVN